MPFTEEELNSIRGGLTAEEYRWKLIRFSNCLQIDIVTHVTPVALRRLVFGELGAERDRTDPHKKPEAVSIGVNRANGGF